MDTKGIKFQNSVKPAEKRVTSKSSDDRQFIPDPYKKVAKGMEQQFIEFMVSQMNKTVGETEPQNSGMNYYKSLLNSERSKAITENKGGLGVQDLILDQIYPKRLRTEVAYQAYQNSLPNKGAIKRKENSQPVQMNETGMNQEVQND